MKKRELWGEVNRFCDSCIFNFSYTAGRKYSLSFFSRLKLSRLSRIDSKLTRYRAKRKNRKSGLISQKLLKIGFMRHDAIDQKRFYE